MAIIDKKQKRWYSKSTFDSLDKTAIPIGTEIQVTGAIEESDLDSDLQTKINGKLTAPNTPTADSVVTLLSNGTVGTKPLSEIGKLYLHSLTILDSTYTLNAAIYASTNTDITNIETLRNFISSDGYSNIGTNTKTSPASFVSFGIQQRDSLGILMLAGVESPTFFVPTKITDTVIEL